MTVYKNLFAPPGLKQSLLRETKVIQLVSKRDLKVPFEIPWNLKYKKKKSGIISKMYNYTEDAHLHLDKKRKNKNGSK